MDRLLRASSAPKIIKTEQEGLRWFPKFGGARFARLALFVSAPGKVWLFPEEDSNRLQPQFFLLWPGTEKPGDLLR